MPDPPGSLAGEATLPGPARPRSSAAPARRSRLGEKLIEFFLRLNGFLAIAAIALIFLFLFKEGLLAFTTISPGDFIQTTELDFDNLPQTVRMWQPVGTHPKYSLVPLICGSLLLAVPATLIATLLGVACGVYLAEVAGKRTREIVKPGIELLAGIPSVVIGFF